MGKPVAEIPIPKGKLELVGDVKSDARRSVRVDLGLGDGEIEEIFIDGEDGPICIQLSWALWRGPEGDSRFGPVSWLMHGHGKHWNELSPSERERYIYMMAKRQKSIREMLEANGRQGFSATETATYIRGQLNWPAGL